MSVVCVCVVYVVTPHRPPYRGTLHCLARMLEEGGVQSWFKGARVTHHPHAWHHIIFQDSVPRSSSSF